MRTRINNITFTPGTRSINTGITSLTIDDIRLIVNESQNKVICSSMQKSNITNINNGVITYSNSLPVLASGDHITFEVDLGDNGAKQGSNPNVSLTSIDEKIDDFYDTFDADMALQLQGIIGEGEESVDGNSQTEGEIERLRTLQESYDALAGNSSAIAFETEVEAGKAAIVDAIEDKGGTASTAMSLTGLAQAIDSIQVPTLLRLNAITFENSANYPIIDMGGIEVLNVSSFNLLNYGGVRIFRNLPLFSQNVSLQNLFNGCVSLQSVDFGTRTNFERVTNVGFLFNNCTALQSVDLSQLDTSGLTTTNSLFNQCSSISYINLRNFHFAGYVYEVFRGCPNLTKVDMINSHGDAITSTGASWFNISNGAMLSLVGDATYQEVVDNDYKILQGMNIAVNIGMNGGSGNGTNNLNQASLRALINGVADRTGQSTLTIYFGPILLAKLSAEDIAVATNKNWTLA